MYYFKMMVIILTVVVIVIVIVVVIALALVAWASLAACASQCPLGTRRRGPRQPRGGGAEYQGQNNRTKYQHIQLSK